MGGNAQGHTSFGKNNLKKKKKEEQEIGFH